MNASPQPVVQELDLRETWRAVLRAKWRIVGFALAAAVIVYGGSHFLPKRYMATAHLVFLDPTALTLDQPGNPGGKLPGARGLSELAKGLASADEMRELGGNGKGGYELLDMSMTTASRRQLTLRVTASTPATAFEGVNRWGEEVLGELTRMVGVDDATMQKAEAEVRVASEKLEARQKELRDHLIATRPGTTTARLDAAQASLANLLAKQRMIDELDVELRSTKTLLESISESQPLPSEFAMGFAFLQARATGFGDAAPASGATQVRTVGEGLAALGRALARLDLRRKAIEQELNALEPRINELTAKVEMLDYQTESLTAEREGAGKAYKALQEQLEAKREAKLHAQDLARVLKQPSPPSRPVSPRPLVNAVLTGVLVLVGFTFWTVVAACWKAGETSPSNTASGTLS